MGTRIVRVAKTAQKSQWCVWEKNGIFPLQEQPRNHRELVEFYSGQRIAIDVDARIEPGSAAFLSPLEPPCQIICQGKNYLDHLLETGVKPENKDYNLLFTKASSSLADPVGELRRPARVKLLDYEIELGLVIKKKLAATTVVSDITKYVGALIMCNDVSARDVQVPERQWFKGKSFRGFCPVGPVLYLLDPSDKNILNDLQLELRVNGKVRQKATTKQMMHDPLSTLSEISGIFDLYPGDLILTGTPGGVAMKITKAGFLQELRGKFLSEKEKMNRFLAEQAMSTRYLKGGDRIESSIRSSDGSVDLGEQHLTVVD